MKFFLSIALLVSATALADNPLNQKEMAELAHRMNLGHSKFTGTGLLGPYNAKKSGCLYDEKQVGELSCRFRYDGAKDANETEIRTRIAYLDHGWQGEKIYDLQVHTFTLGARQAPEISKADLMSLSRRVDLGYTAMTDGRELGTLRPAMSQCAQSKEDNSKLTCQLRYKPSKRTDGFGGDPIIKVDLVYLGAGWRGAPLFKLENFTVSDSKYDLPK